LEKRTVSSFFHSLEEKEFSFKKSKKICFCSYFGHIFLLKYSRFMKKTKIPVNIAHNFVLFQQIIANRFVKIAVEDSYGF